jgi:phage-related baseplate assembly protein
MSSLQEPSFITRDAAAVTSEMIAAYEEATGKTLQPAQVERLLIDLIAYREMLLRVGIQEAAKQCLVEYAAFPMLDYLGELVGVTRLAASYATTVVRFTLTGAQEFDVTVPAGTRVETKDREYTFATEEAATIAAGGTSADVNAVAETAGAGANGYLAGEINALVDAVAYVASAANTTTSADGSAEETDDRLRERIKQAPEAFSNAGSTGAYRYHAMSAHQDIVDVAVTSPSAGVVNVYPLTAAGGPSGTIIGAVEDALNAEKVRPLTDQVYVLAPTEVTYGIEAGITLYVSADQETVEAAVEAALDEYATELAAELGRDIIRSQIIGRIMAVDGVYNATLASPAADTVVDDDEYATCGGVTVTVTGTADG